MKESATHLLMIVWRLVSNMTRARQFSPRLGRFTQADPFFHAVNGNLKSCLLQSGNLFLFTMHNPIRWTDPTGLWSKDIHEELTRLALEFIGADTGMEDLFASFADYIVAGNLGVDDPPYRAARFWSQSAQSRHFNRNSANRIDTRLDWAEMYLIMARETWYDADRRFARGVITTSERDGMRGDALYLLGRGLHSIQDIEAHGNIGMGWRGALFAVHVDPRTDSRHYDWSNNSRRWVTSSTEQVRFNTSLNDSVEFLNRFFTAIGLN